MHPKDIKIGGTYYAAVDHGYICVRVDGTKLREKKTSYQCSGVFSGYLYTLEANDLSAERPKP